MNKHKCWKLDKKERPNHNHYRFCCIEKTGRFSFEEIWHCWECWKEVRYKIPFRFLKKYNFEKSLYYKYQKCKNLLWKI